MSDFKLTPFELRPIEIKVLEYLIEHGGNSHRSRVVHALASPGSRTAQRSKVCGGGSNGAIPLIMGRWCQRLIRAGMVSVATHSGGYYHAHCIERPGRDALHELYDELSRCQSVENRHV